MKKNIKEILRIFTVAIFSLALLLPTAVKFAHTLEGHEHQACTDFSVHIHKKQLDCSICDFHFSIFDFKPQELPEFSVLNGFQKTETVYLLPKFNKNTSHYFLRGPPQFS
ncbi:hypothetical protein [Aequorivita antarctica]|uniref:DUF2946 domain-containing protein n=1 Tax=Aequorivita antarctica TaxID=153266 RepID=A0A5C6Z466_9FLAO|nr:hypothetical protein [Aequorivita antarctica]TXD74234.1 hypothetical protein ESU54_02990 [Aequorivita antarctica]SRX73573.1 hypothetical protein AEQU3_01005 [Aequorivita antarctica]